MEGEIDWQGTPNRIERIGFAGRRSDKQIVTFFEIHKHVPRWLLMGFAIDVPRKEFPGEATSLFI